MFEKIVILFIGISSVFFGRYLFFNRTLYDWDFGWIDFGSYHWVIGIIFIIGGMFFVYNATKMIIRDKRKGRPPR
jgi:hypothetical protein